jgi:hypothetical protein
MGNHSFEITPLRLAINYTWIGLNALASLLTLFLLRCSKKENEYNNIIYQMTLAQFLFDFSFSLKYRGVIDENSTNFTVIYNAFDISFSSAAGVATGCYALVICAILCRIVVSMKYIDLAYYKKMILITTSFLAISFFLALLIPELIHTEESHVTHTIVYSIYNFTRILIIFIILLLSIRTYRKIKKMKLVTEGDNVHPVYLLAKRLFLYPVVQFMTRMPNFVYQLNYGSFYDYHNDPKPSYFQTMVYNIITLYVNQANIYISQSIYLLDLVCNYNFSSIWGHR